MTLQTPLSRIMPSFLRLLSLGIWVIIFSSFLVFAPKVAQAADFISSATGNWNIGTTWGGGCASSCVAGTDYPGASDTATVTSTHTVTVPTSFTANFTSITVRGTAILKLTGQLSGGDLTVKTGATVQQDTTSLQTLTGTLSVESGGTLTHTANATTQAYVVNFTVGAATIAGTVSANAKGYQGGTSSVNAGSGPGGSVYTGVGGGGAAYGGNGGYGHTGVGATSYGSLMAPTHAGSGGSYGGSGAANGGAGGGYIAITATNLTLTGTIAANGGAGVAVSTVYSASGGSGGGIYLNVSGTFNGSGGTITATGGAGTIMGGAGSGGGGGGRVAIVGYTSYTAPTTFTAYGGAGGGGASATGGAGSLFVKSNSNNGTATYNNNASAYGTLSTLSNTDIDEIIVKNGAGISIPVGVSVTTTQSSFSNLTAVSTNISIYGTFNPQTASFTFTSSSNVLFGSTANLKGVTDLTINGTNSTLTNGATLSATDLTIGTGATLTLVSYTTSTSPLSLTSLTVNGTLTTSANTTILSHIVNVSATTVTVGAAGSIQVNAKGYQGGTSSVNAGSGPGGATYTGSGGAGAAYGGNGGYGVTGAGPSSVGSLTAPNDAGSGGTYGGSATAVGGAGGGLIKITATNLTLAGTIAANGGAPTTYAPFYTGSGGSGGGIYLNVSGTFNGSGGTITATGGAGTTLGGYGSGGGAGGRVAIVGYTTYTAPTTFTAYGGTKGGGNAANGGAGSLFVKSSSNNGTATYNNNGSTDGTLSTLSNTDIDEIVIKNGAGLSIPLGVSVTTTQSTFNSPTGVASTIYLAGTFNPQNATFTFPASTTVSFVATGNLKTVADLTINSTNSTIYPGFTHALSNLTIGTGATFTMDSYTTSTTPFTVPTITIDGTLTHTTNSTAQTHVVNISSTSFTLSSGGLINVNNKGYRGGQTGSTTGLGPGGATYTATGGSGAAHGGVGGNGNGSTGSTVTYGSAIAPSVMGSGGSYGGSGAANGGAGGGVVQIAAVTATIAGTISANGQIGTAAATYYAGGGGSGGSVYLNVSGSYNGTGGTITANGGAGIIANAYGGGGGGGGRIAIGTLEGAITNIGTVTVSGGTKGIAAAQDGAVGTKANRPNSTLVLEGNYTNLTLPAAITGTSTYQFNQVSSVAITIQRASDDYYWDGADWGSPVVWLAASGTSTWSYSLAGITLTNLETYTVLSRATDSLSIVESVLPSATFSYTANSAPSAPTAVDVSAVATSTLTLSWTDNSSGPSQETSFIILSSLDDTTYTTAASVSADVTTTDLTGLTPNTLYYFKVAAFNTEYGSGTSTSVSTSTHVNVPSAFGSSANTVSSIALTWSVNGNAVGTVYELLNQTTSTWSMATTTDTSYVVSGLTANSTYTFALRALQIDSSPTLYSSEIIYATSTLPLAPAAPSDLVFSDVATSSMILSWTDNSSDTSQEGSMIVYQSTNGTNYSVYSSYAADTISSNITGLTPNKTYYFKVTAENVSGAATSTAVSTSTTVNAPISLTVGTITTSTVPLTWSGDGNATTTVYEILNQSTSTWSIATTTATAYTVTGLQGNTLHTFGVRALQIESTPATYSSTVTVATTTVTNTPTAPSDLILTNVATSTATLSWTDNASGDVQETTIYILRSTDNSSYSVISTLAADTLTTQVTGLTPNKTYYFKVSASNVSGSGLSSAVSSSTHLLTPTGFGSGFTTTSTIPLTWSANGNAVGTVYEIFQQTTSTWLVATTTATTYTVTDLVYDSSYTFGLRAIQNGNVPTIYSETVTYTTSTYLEVPTAPTSAILTDVSTSTATLSWTDTSSDSMGETSMRISHSTDDVTYTVIQTLPANTVTSGLTNLTPNTTHYFKVSAVNRSGEGASTAVSTTTLVMTPSTLTAIGIATSTVPLTWSANGNGAGTVYEVLNQTTSTWLIATTTATSYTVRTLNSQSTYTFGVRATQVASSPVSYSEITSYTTSTHLDGPGAPSSLVLSNVATSTATLTWTDNSSGGTQESSMVVSRSTDGVSYAVVATLAADTTSADISSLTPNTTYYFTVTAVNVSDSAVSSAVSTSTLVMTPATLAVGSVTASTASLTWSANGNGAGTVYEILNQTTSTWSIATTTATSYTVVTLDSNTAYTFGLRAEQNGSESLIYSSIITITTSTALDAPSAPSSLVLSEVTTSTLDLSWTDNASGGTQESSMVVSLSTNGSSYTTVVTLPADTTNTTVTGLIPNKLYYFKVAAVNVSGSALSSAVTTTTLPMAPTSLDAASLTTTSTVSLTWSANGNDSGTVYEIRDVTGAPSSLATTTATTYTVTALSPSTAYVFGVRALHRDSDPTSYSSEVTYATSTTAVLPLPPTSLLISDVSTSSLALTWTDASSGESQETSVRISSSLDNVSFTDIQTLAADSTTTTVSGLTPNVLYYLKVTAINLAGSTESSAISTTTLPVAPTGLSATGLVTASTVSLTWSGNGNATNTVYEILNQTTSTWSIDTTTSTTYQVTGLEGDTLHTFAVRALQRDSSPTYYSATVTFSTTTLLNAPLAPSAVVASNVATSTLTLSWTDSSSVGFQETSVQILRSIDDSAYTTVETLPADTTTTDLSALTPNTTYYFKVVAVNASGSSTSTAISTTTIAIPGSIDPPTDVVATALGSAVTISWTNPADLDFASITIRRSTTSFPASVSSGTLVASGLTGTTQSQTGLADGTYYYSLFALSQYGHISSVATSSVTVDTDAPLLTSVTSTAAADSAVVTWTTDGLATSRIWYATNESYASSTAELDAPLGVTEHTVPLSGLLPCISYRYLVVSEDLSGNTATSSEDTFTTTGCIGGATILEKTDDTISIITGGEITLGSDGDAVTLTIASSYNDADASFQLKRLQKAPVLDVLEEPLDYDAAGGEHVFDFHAFKDGQDSIHVFTAPIQVAMRYNPGDIGDLDESSLRIFRYDEGAWSVLSSCSVDTSSRTVTCLTFNFSSFGLFGQVVVPSSGGGGGGSSYLPVIPQPLTTTPLAPNQMPLSLAFRIDTGSGITTDRTIDLSFNADPKTVRGYAVSVDPAFAYANLIDPYVSTTTFVLPATPGVYAVYVRYFSTTGISSQTLAQIVTYRPAGAVPVIKPTAPSKKPVLFLRTLKLGDKGEDVKRLQQFLNANGCVVAKTGAGSKGKETTLFGPLMQKAVKACQEKNAALLLKPAKLKKGTGLFGDLMRTWANTLLSKGK